MSRDGSGNYTRPNNSFSTPVTGTLILAADADALFDDIDSALTDSLSRTGKGGMSADLDMSNNDINNAKTVVLKGSTSGTTTVQPTAIAGTTTLTLPAATDTLVGKSTTDTLANKTLVSPSVTGTALLNSSLETLQPFLNNEVFSMVLSAAHDGATQGETVMHFDTYGANSNGTLLFTKSGGGAQFTASISGSVMTVTAMGTGSLAIAVGQRLSAVGVPDGTKILSFGTGAGGTGTYNLSANVGTFGSALMLTNDSPTAPTGTKNGQGLGFIIASGWYGGVGTRTTQCASIQFNAEGDWTASSWPTGINILTTPTGGTELVQRANIASSGALNWFQNSIGSTLTDGIALKNNTSASAGAQQQSPSLHLAGQGWKTNATAASQPVDWWVTNAPIQGAANPSTSLVFSYAINNGSVTRVMSLTPGGLDIAGGTGFTIGGAAPTTGHVLRSNGTAFVDSQLSVSDLTGFPLTFAQGGTNDTGTAATSFTPTVNFTGGTGTSSTGSTGAYKQIGAKLYYVTMDLVITYSTIPTSFNVTLPNGFTTAVRGFLFGQNTSTGLVAQARSNASATTAGNIIDYAGNLAITASGQTVTLSGVLTNT